MNVLANKTLLAILLALDNLEAPLSTTEQAILKRTGQQLAMCPEDWESITQELMDALATHPTFKEIYEVATIELVALDSAIPPGILPTEDELIQVLPPGSKVLKRAYFEGKPDLESNEILNLAISILNAPNPSGIVKQISLRERISQFLNKHIF